MSDAFLVAGLFTLALSGCGGPGSATIDGESALNDGDDDDINPGDDDDDDDDGVPTFESDIVPLIERSCGSGDNNCHSQVAYGADASNDCKGWLSLENVPLGSVLPDSGAPTGCPDMDLYDRLTQLGAWQCFVNGAPDDGIGPTEWKYVAPLDLDGSYLWQKVNGGILCDLGGGEKSEDMPIAVTLTQEDLDLIEAWIMAGRAMAMSSPTPAS